MNIVLFSILFMNYLNITISDTNERSPNWLANCPADKLDQPFHSGELVDVTSDTNQLKVFEDLIENAFQTEMRYGDGEVVDALEHYFWGQRDGIAMEMGAADGIAHSQTYDYEQKLGWSRILVEADPSMRDPLIKNAPHAFSVSAAACRETSKVHFHDIRQHKFINGILEFMSPTFLEKYHYEIYNAGVPKGNLSSIDWSSFSSSTQEVDCMPLSDVFAKARIRHINFFILDVEGGESEVLRSINWALIKFDVICVETERANRPNGYPEHISDYLQERGYINHSGTEKGRNMWFIHPDFKPKLRPLLSSNPDCFSGVSRRMNLPACY